MNERLSTLNGPAEDFYQLHAQGFEPTTPFNTDGSFLSPETFSTFDEYAANPRFLELQEELRAIIFTGVASLAPSRVASPEPNSSTHGQTTNTAQQPYDLTRTSVPQKKMIEYLKNWITECAPWLDMFDEARHFGITAPIMARGSPALLYGMLALSARQVERQKGLGSSNDSLQLYQESISLLTPILEAKDPNVLVTACILCCLEMMSVSPRDWRRHVEGCAALFDSFGVHGFSGSVLQAVFWCYARMDLCGAIISDGAERTVLPIQQWVASSTQLTKDQEEAAIRQAFLERGYAVPDMHANWAVYLCAKVCDLVYRRTRFLELGEPDHSDTRSYSQQWQSLWDELQFWVDHRPPEMLPVSMTKTSSHQLFPEIFFAQWAAISGNQLYHTACILMLEIQSGEMKLQPSLAQFSAVWHARRVIGISLTNPHRGCLNNAIQPLYVAGKLLSHRTEHDVVANIINTIERTTGWGARWRLKDLERAWGYEPGEISNIN